MIHVGDVIGYAAAPVAVDRVVREVGVDRGSLGHGAGFRAILLPAMAPLPYWSEELRAGLGAASASGVHVVLPLRHRRREGRRRDSPTLRQVRAMADELNQPMDRRLASKRMMTQCVYNTINPQQIIIELIGGGVPERYPDLHFALIEFNAHWLASLVGAMDKCWVTGIGQDADWWLGYWDDDPPDDDQPQHGAAVRLNEKWPYPLMPSEYVQRQFHVSFQDDPVAVACRHITGLSTIMWGNDYPHAEGTFRGSQELIEPAVRRRAGRRARSRCSAARSATSSGSRPRSRPERAPLRRARRDRHRRRTRHRPRVRAAARRTRGAASSSTTSAARWRRRRGRRAGAAVADEIIAAGGDGDRRRAATSRRPTGAQALVAAAVDRFGRSTSSSTTRASSDGPGFPTPTPTTSSAPRGARRRVVQHHPRRLAAHGRAGLRPHRDDDVDRHVRTARPTPRTRRRRAASSG